MIKKNIWLLGSGQMSLEYFKVLRKLNCKFKIIGRGLNSSRKFKKKTNYDVDTNGLNYNIRKYGAPKVAIIAVSADQLSNVTKSLIKAGTKRLLVEKPGSLNIYDLKKIKRLSNVKKSKTYIAYNRRFYDSVIQAEKIIYKDGGLKSISFDFTEWSSKIKKLNINSSIKKKWLISNSSHVIDLAFYFCGVPKIWSYWSSGNLEWHQKARFCGAGVSNKGVLFSYLSDWSSSGRWGIELMTLRHKLKLRPMEKLEVMRLNSLNTKSYKQKNLDLKFKPGLFLQTKAFLNNEDNKLCSIEDQVKNFDIYYKIAGYKK